MKNKVWNEKGREWRENRVRESKIRKWNVLAIVWKRKWLHYYGKITL